MAQPPFTLELYQDEAGHQPVRRWLREELTLIQRQALGAAMNEILQEEGVAVCRTEFGRQLGGGLFEFRVRLDPAEVIRRMRGSRRQAARPTRITLRVFCHAWGERVILLLGGYDKAADPSPGRQRKEIELARARLASWQRRRRGR